MPWQFNYVAIQCGLHLAGPALCFVDPCPVIDWFREGIPRMQIRTASVVSDFEIDATEEVYILQS